MRGLFLENIVCGLASAAFVIIYMKISGVRKYMSFTGILPKKFTAGNQMEVRYYSRSILYRKMQKKFYCERR